MCSNRMKRQPTAYLIGLILIRIQYKYVLCNRRKEHMKLDFNLYPTFFCTLSSTNNIFIHCNIYFQMNRLCQKSLFYCKNCFHDQIWYNVVLIGHRPSFDLSAQSSFKFLAVQTFVTNSSINIEQLFWCDCRLHNNYWYVCMQCCFQYLSLYLPNLASSLLPELWVKHACSSATLPMPSLESTFPQCK